MFLIVIASLFEYILTPFFLLQSAFQSEEDYHKRIGYREENGTIESTENYLNRLESYMSLYAVLIQVWLISYSALNEWVFWMPNLNLNF